MLIEKQAGNRDGVRAAYDALMASNTAMKVSMEPEAERVYDAIMRRSAYSGQHNEVDRSRMPCVRHGS
ncbi:hypothetical protein [Streptomyces mutabilis]|jgi:hypothetical protein|uniref:hypothetical protein n=1 Tax=Streptomyces mutabilis TaxID=67332 RepID=UPI0036C29BEA